ncbi:ATP-dependent Clp protease proteolytic subunit 3, chloroplastic [Tanacetum coccineum]
MSTILSESALEKALQAALELLKKAAQVLLKKAAEALKRHAGALARKLLAFALEKLAHNAEELSRKAAKLETAVGREVAQMTKPHSLSALKLVLCVIRMGIYAAMKQRKADISTICVGLAASMDAFLLACGNRHEYYMNQRKGVSQGQVSKIISRVSGTPLREGYKFVQFEADTAVITLCTHGQKELMDGPKRYLQEWTHWWRMKGDGRKTEEAASA